MSRLTLALAFLLPTPLVAETIQHGLRVPNGFSVTQYADSTLANDIYCLTINPKGDVLVSGRGYLRILVDPTGEGKASKVLEFANAPKDGAMGLHWEGDNLYCMGEGGLRRYRDAYGKGRTQPSKLLYPFKTGGEHHAHAIRRGPDGWLYVLLGNFTGIGSKHATLDTSPIREPIAGCVMRFPPDFNGSEIVSDGLRNAYGMDFNSKGDLFAYDSDNERCVSLPWYEGTRCYHILPGGHCGWQAPQRAETWRVPPDFVDFVAPLADLGRGSPTGVAAYRHTQFPKKYQDSLFLLDWTFGRVYLVELEPQGSSYTTKVSVFLEAVGDNGFAPTGVAYHPITGDLYVSVGGRGTRGAVYRIRHEQGYTNLDPKSKRLPAASRSLEWSAQNKAKLLDRARDANLQTRRRALEQIWRFASKFSPEELTATIRANWDNPDRYICQATARLFARLPQSEQRKLARTATSPRQQITLGLSRGGADLSSLLVDAETSVSVRFEAIRLVQMFVGDVPAPRVRGTVWEGYTRREEKPIPKGMAETILRAFPSESADLDRELARTLAMLEVDAPTAQTKIAAKMTADSSPIEDFHYLIVFARLHGSRTREMTEHIATALCALDGKLTQRKLYRDRWWPIRFAEMHKELAKKDPKLNAPLLEHPDFGRADHVLFTRCPGFDKRRAAMRFLEQSKRDPNFEWNSDLVKLIGQLPPEKYRPVVEQLWGVAGLDSVLLPLIAKKPLERDRRYFLEGLGSANIALVQQSLTGLRRLPIRDNSDQTVALLLALRRTPVAKEFDSLRESLRSFLAKSTGENYATPKEWEAWFSRTYPALAKKLVSSSGLDLEGWNRKLASVDWGRGDVEAGLTVYKKTQCASCHSGARALGPDLRGATTRFSRDDLFAAILQPNKEVPPRYRSTLFETNQGQVYQGVVIYEAVDSVILQTGPTETVRLAHPQISERRLTATSLMPSGLLDKLTTRELADLYAYLETLR